ncbi:MAG TPA: hypothetical protein VKM93_03955 [Terriglobia bacterium]|nr:hypothetical protein [Terriglobia bacterium]
MRNFISQLFSESGVVSFGRLGSFVALLSACGWVTYIVFKTRALPGLDGLTFFIASLYGLGKAGETAQRLFGNKPQQ